MFLLGSLVLAFLGASIAWWDGFFSFPHVLLAFVALLLWHVSANVLNEYFDYRSGIDLNTKRTPFSGGSGILPARLLEAESVLRFGLLSFVLAVPIWTYYVIDRGLLLLPLIGIGAICVLLYTPFLTKWRMAELSSAVGIGASPVLAFYFVQAGGYGMNAVVVAIASGMWMFNLHLLNELPDVEPDSVGGRRTLPIIMGRAKAGWLYVAGTMGAYAWVVAWVAAGIMPRAALLVLLTLPLALRAMKGALSYRDQASFTPALWASGITYFLGLALLALGYVVARL